jgi:hypothetical protein
MTLPVERKLPGEPIHREQLVAEWEDLHHRNMIEGPGGPLRKTGEYSPDNLPHG